MSDVSLGTRSRYSLVVDEDVKKLTNQSNTIELILSELFHPIQTVKCHTFLVGLVGEGQSHFAASFVVKTLRKAHHGTEYFTACTHLFFLKDFSLQIRRRVTLFCMTFCTNLFQTGFLFVFFLLLLKKSLLTTSKLDFYGKCINVLSDVVIFFDEMSLTYFKCIMTYRDSKFHCNQNV